MHPRRFRALTSVELMLAMAITILVGMAMAGLMRVAAMGVESRRDNRTVMVRTGIFQARLSAYVTPSRAILCKNPAGGAVVWFDDHRGGESIHASELRWMIYDMASGTIEVQFVHFPDTMTDLERDLADSELPQSLYDDWSDWMTVRQAFDGAGWLVGVTLVDGLESAGLAPGTPSQQLAWELDFDGTNGAVTTTVSATVRFHRPAAY